jgi:hypothetical protein
MNSVVGRMRPEAISFGRQSRILKIDPAVRCPVLSVWYKLFHMTTIQAGYLYRSKAAHFGRNKPQKISHRPAAQRMEL